jgi:beta-phosphoglucomutase family hydrolase
LRRRGRSEVLGLPQQVRGCLFDLDGVLTRTATVHAAAWKEMFDAFLRARGERTGEALAPFDASSDYERYVDGKPREDGTRSFLAARGITLPAGEQGDSPGVETVCGLGNWKNQILLRLLRERGAAPYEGSIRYVRAARAEGLATAVVSSSSNCREVLLAAKMADLFDVRIDGLVARQQHLHGKPAPDTYVAAARAVHLTPSQCAVFEDALAGVEAGRAGGFGLVVGVDRTGEAAQLRAQGADVVVADLGALLEAP